MTAPRLIHPLDRSRQTPAMHRLHGYEPQLAQVFQFALAVVQFKESWRHDLYVPAAQRRAQAAAIFSLHLAPQLQLQLALSLGPEEEGAAGPRPQLRSWGIRLDTLQRIQTVLLHTSSSASEAGAGTSSAVSKGWESSAGPRPRLAVPKPSTPSSSSGSGSSGIGIGQLIWSAFAATPKVSAPRPVPVQAGVEVAEPLDADAEDTLSYAELFDDSFEEVLQSLMTG